jgi:ATP-dependent DNA helicase RecG
VSTPLDEIQQLAAQGESDQVEFKRSTGQRTEAAKTVCAMLNGRGGFVLFGVEDDGRIVGQQVAAGTLEGITRELRKIEPLAPVNPELIELAPHRCVILLRVPKGGGPHTYDGRAYLRLGPTTSIMPADEQRRLVMERTHPAMRWETEPAHGLRIDDLDAEEIVRTAEEAIRRQRLEEPGTRNIADLLLGFGLLREGQITNAAVVLFGRREKLLPLYPQCSLRLARFRGRDMSEFLDSRHEVGNAFDLFVRAQRFFRDHLPVAGRVVANVYEREDDPLYPPVALREALSNALCHRDYSVPGGSVGVAIFDDRLELSSTGPLRFGLRPADLLRPHASLPWNPTIASVFYLRGLIEKWGRGTLKISELSERAGLLRPEFEERNADVVVRFLPSAYIPPTRVSHELTPLQREILMVLADAGPTSSVRIQAQFTGSYSNDKVLRELKQLRDLDLIEKLGTTSNTRWRLLG